MDKIRNNVEVESPEFTRNRLKMINYRYNQILNMMINESNAIIESDLSSELNYSDSLDQKAAYIYVEELQYQYYVRQQRKKKKEKQLKVDHKKCSSTSKKKDTV